MADIDNGLGNLFAKLAAISGELGAVPQDAKHQQGYMYHSADSVLGALNPLLSKYQVVIIPSASNARVELGADTLSRWVIDYQFTIADGETGAYFVANWTSEGIMSVGKDANSGVPKADDKSMGKAHTYALKYWLIQLFKISTKDTVDLDQNNQDEKPAKPATKQNKPAAPLPAKDPLDPETHFGTPEVQSTGEIKVVEVKQGQGKHPYIVAGNMAFFTRQPFRDLGYEDALIERLGVPKKEVYLPDPIVIEYVEMTVGDKKQRTPQRVLRLKTNEVAVVLATR